MELAVRSDAKNTFAVEDLSCKILNRMNNVCQKRVRSFELSVHNVAGKNPLEITGHTGVGITSNT